MKKKPVVVAFGRSSTTLPPRVEQPKLARKPGIPEYQPVKKERRSRRARTPASPKVEDQDQSVEYTVNREMTGKICD